MLSGHQSAQKNIVMGAKAKVITEKEIQQNSDPHIDQDFPGYPQLPSNKKNINPVTATQKKLTGIDKKKSKKVYGS